MDEQAFDEFYAASFPRVIGQVHAMIGDRDEAQECVLEAFVRAWAHRRKLDRAEHPEAWVRTTAYRLAVSRWPIDRPTTRLDGPAEVHAREVQLFADDAAAAAYAASVREVYAACPEESDGGPGTITTVVSPMELGKDAFAAKRSYSGIGRVVVQVVRVGNAVLVNLDSDEGADVEAMAMENEQALGGVYDAMQVFSERNRPAGRS